MKITKHKTDKPGVWALRVNGRLLPYTVEKDDAPRFGMRQEWLLCRGDYPIFSSPNGVGALVDFLNDFMTEATANDAG